MPRTESWLPEWVLEANRRLRGRPRLPSVGRSLRSPEVGDLCVAEPVEPGAAAPAIVCVVEVDHGLATVRAALASPETDLASGADLLAAATDSGLPFDLMVESDVEGRLWWTQVERRVGRLGERLAGLVRDAVRLGAAAAPAGVRGVPVVAADDPRRELRDGERSRLGALVADCERATAGGLSGLPLLLDPALLAGLPAGDGCSRSVGLEAIARELATAGRPIVPVGAVPAVLEAWDAGGSRLDPDLWRALQPCLQRTLAAPPGPAAPVVAFEPPRARTPAWAEEALAETCGGLLLSGARSIRLLTTTSAWSGDRPGAPAVAMARTGGGALQLIRHNLEVNP